jgi:carbon storage regulator
MLIISRKAGESFFIGDDIEVTICEIGPDKIRVGINAPKDISICRKEIRDIKEENTKASKTVSNEKLKSLSSYLSELSKNK